jgi:hypothetical protein
MADDWKSYVDLDGTTVLQHVKAPTTVAELLEKHGLHRAQLVQNAAGTEHHLIAELISEAWQLADFAARHELVPRVAELQGRIDQIRAVLAAHYDADADTGTEVNVVARITSIIDSAPPAPETWSCTRCSSDRWVGWRAGPEHEGWPRKAQCVPCGHVQALPAMEEVPGG